MNALPPAAGASGRAEPAQASPGQRRTDLSGLVWRTLLHPRLLLVCALIALSLVGASLFLPQLPGQFRDEPAASARWLLTTAAEFGAAGPLMRGAGLFDVIHSLLFRLVLALLTMVLSAHLADRIGTALAFLRLERDFCSTDARAVVGERTLAAVAPFRRRSALVNDPAATHDRALHALSIRFDRVRHCAAAAADLAVERGSHPADADDEKVYLGLGARNSRSFYLRPLLPLGLLAALAVVWIYLFSGWELRAPTLAPGETYRAPSRDVLIAYNVQGGTADELAEANATVQIGSRIITATTATGFQAQLGSSRITGRSRAPALLVGVADGTPLLSEPGQPDLASEIGVVLPSPGSEELLVVPDLAWGLRIVRRSDDASAFYVEIYEGDELRPQERIEVSGPLQTTASVGGETLDLVLVPFPGIDVTVRHMPGRWLLWTAAALSLIGFAGVLRAPSLALAETKPWPENRSVVTLHASRADELAVIAAELEPKEAGAPADVEDPVAHRSDPVAAANAGEERS